MPHVGFRCVVGTMLLALVCLLNTSCSSEKYYPVKGKVLLNDKPLANATVAFHPKGSANLKTTTSTGVTKEDGTFTLMTGDKEGAPAGEYVVTIICSETVGVKKGEIATGPPETVDKLKGAYADKSKSQITVTITAGENNLEPFKLK